MVVKNAKKRFRRCKILARVEGLHFFIYEQRSAKCHPIIDLVKKSNLAPRFVARLCYTTS